MAYINGNEVNDAILVRNIGVNYSNDEHFVGTWIDGKPLYEKTLTITDLPLTSLTNLIPHHIANVDFGFVAEVIGYSSTEDYTKTYINSNIRTMTNTSQTLRQTMWGMDGINIAFRQETTTSVNIDTVYITVRYTKTTDHAAQ